MERKMILVVVGGGARGRSLNLSRTMGLVGSLRLMQRSELAHVSSSDPAQPWGKTGWDGPEVWGCLEALQCSRFLNFDLRSLTDLAKSRGCPSIE